MRGSKNMLTCRARVIMAWITACTDLLHMLCNRFKDQGTVSLKHRRKTETYAQTKGLKKKSKSLIEMLQNLIFWSDIFLYWMISLYFWYDQLLRSLKDLKLLRNFTFCVSALVKLYPGYCITVHICWYTFQNNGRHNASVSTFYAKTISSNLKTVNITFLFNSIMQFWTIKT